MKTPPAPEGDTLIATVIDRIKALEGVTTDRDVAVLLDSASSHIANWRARGTVPWDRLFTYSRARGVSLDWLLNGRGPPRPDLLPGEVAEGPGAYRARLCTDPVYDVSALCMRAVEERGVKVSSERFARLVRSLHRDMLERGETAVPYERVLDRVALLE